jgi:hypothetical protein
VGTQGPKMGRKLLGYDPSSVESMLSERDAMLAVAERRVQAAQARIAELEQRMRPLEERLALQEAAAAKKAEAQEQQARAAPPPEAGPEDLTKVVNAAEASASQIIQAWMSTRDQIVQADHLWRDVQEEVVRFAAWRDDVEPLMQQVQAFIEEARAEIERVPERVQLAMSPAVDAMLSVSEGMARFAEVSTMPLLPTPLRRAVQDPGARYEPAPEPGEPPAAFDEEPEYEEAGYGDGFAAELGEAVPIDPMDAEQPDEAQTPVQAGWVGAADDGDHTQLDSLSEALTQSAQPNGQPEYFG